MTQSVRTATQSDTGRQREINEDSVLCEQLNDNYYLLAVADGMGGHQAGDVASQIAITELKESVTRAFDGDLSTVEPILNQAITKANDEIQDLAADDPDLEGMGTTLVSAILSDDEISIANVGDSRAYLVGETIEQITEDQNLARELVEQGTLNEDELDEHPHRHVLSQALGTAESVEPDFYEVTLDSQTLLLCSDGLSEEVDDTTIQKTVSGADSLEAASDRLIRQANANGGSDNISVVLAARNSPKKKL